MYLEAVNEIVDFLQFEEFFASLACQQWVDDVHPWRQLPLVISHNLHNGLSGQGAPLCGSDGGLYGR